MKEPLSPQPVFLSELLKVRTRFSDILEHPVLVLNQTEHSLLFMLNSELKQRQIVYEEALSNGNIYFIDMEKYLKLKIFNCSVQALNILHFPPLNLKLQDYSQLKHLSIDDASLLSEIGGISSLQLSFFELRNLRHPVSLLPLWGSRNTLKQLFFDDCIDVVDEHILKHFTQIEWVFATGFQLISYANQKFFNQPLLLKDSDFARPGLHKFIQLKADQIRKILILSSNISVKMKVVQKLTQMRGVEQIDLQTSRQDFKVFKRQLIAESNKLCNINQRPKYNISLLWVQISQMKDLVIKI